MERWANLAFEAILYLFALPKMGRENMLSLWASSKLDEHLLSLRTDGTSFRNGPDCKGDMP